ncbi:MAG TPA: hypothetical protein VIF62_38285, partial [Labilithrix sp.]
MTRTTLASLGSLLVLSAACGASSASSGDAPASANPPGAPPPADVTPPPASDPTDAGDDAGDDGIVVNPKPSGKGFPGAYSSPTIVRVGTTYHAYFAKQSFGGKHYNVPHAKFDDAGNFTVVGEALPKLGAGADDADPYEVWAPAVAQIDATHWMLYYAATVSG